MKKLFFCFLLLSSSLVVFSQQDSIILTGILKGQQNEKIYLSFNNNAGKRENYWAQAVNDVFRLKVKKQDEPVVARLGTAIKRDLSKSVDGKNYGNPAPALDFLFANQAFK